MLSILLPGGRLYGPVAGAGYCPGHPAPFVLSCDSSPKCWNIVLGCRAVLKLDGVDPLMSNPPPTSSTKKKYI